FTIMLTLAIFGCSKTAVGTGSGGGSSGGGGGGGGGNTPRTFSVQGQIGLTGVGGIIIQAHEQFIVSIYSFKDEAELTNVNIEYYALDNSYKIAGIPAGDVYVIKAVKQGLTLSALVWGAAGETKTVNLSPISTVAAEIVSANPVVQATLEAANENTDMGVVETILNDIVEYYTNDSAALDELTASVNAGNLNAADLPAAVLDGVNDTVANESRTLTTAVYPAGTGTVEPNGGVYLRGTRLRLTAVPSDGYEFQNWSSGGSNPLEIELTNSVTNVIANFGIVSNYTAPNTFTAQGVIAFKEAGGMSTQALTEQRKIKVSSFKTGGNFDFVRVKLNGDNTYTVANLPLGEVCVIEVVRGGRAKLKNLVWGTADGEIKTADLTPTSTITVAVLLAGGN
ncbi:hypothetical protein NO1_2259, partial [Candidatus Termititenax aidoneus]